MAQPRKKRAGKDTSAAGAQSAPHAIHQQKNGSSAPVAGNGDHSRNLHPSIAVLAYELYERRGRTDGHDMEDWLKAEELLNQQEGRTRRA